MGGLSIWDALVLLVFLGIPAVIIAGVLLFIHRRSRVTATPAGDAASERLVQLQTLRERGLITQEEYETRRAAVLQQIRRSGGRFDAKGSFA